jgi:hypothetical protein
MTRDRRRVAADFVRRADTHNLNHEPVRRLRAGPERMVTR